MMDDSDLELIDEHVEDCADYFATVLTDSFPEVDLIAFQPNEWRKGWRIVIPPQFTESIGDVEIKARDVRDQIWWGNSVLIPYVIERPKD